MYIFIGEDVMIRSKDIIAIVNRESLLSTYEYENFIEKNEKKVIRLGENECKSIVVTHQNIYLSPFASTTLKKRTLKPLL
ncbi:hypothetical protein Q73_00025 [Bacillus coahuilensis m2-6]|uniref:extracellular matrix regulator RemB n=1 Tax=Bacillus coahuilensis TaxID=408580 RepID=UPI00075021BF|nr:extracellular matrix/biofilm biosynthesis regulator RemA family protein [Bacillus coahuilensis]KUP09970.1 hypothetical protein Q73_00025 [Bacillus coahuilensis m2-6]